LPRVVDWLADWPAPTSQPAAPAGATDVHADAHAPVALACGQVWQSLSASHSNGTTPASLEGVPLADSTHVALFLQGLAAHSLTSFSQFLPAQPFAQVHLRALAGTERSVVESAHLPPLKQPEVVHSLVSAHFLPSPEKPFLLTSAGQSRRSERKVDVE